MFKRLFDVVVISALLLLVFPFLFLLLLIAGLERIIFMDPGPFFIFEPRISKGAVFQLIKINMYKEKNRQRYVESSDEFKKHGTYAPLQTQSESLTYVGRLMKKYYLDELGQLFNVLCGDMSLVGCRPLPVGYEENSLAPRRDLKAGIVGFTATRWKNDQRVIPAEADMEYHDLYYRESVWGLLRVDSLILLDGLRAIWKGRGL